MHAHSIAIVGGGPAGALGAAELARAGREVLLFDEKLAWEKPCGGGITPKALDYWPFLREAEVARNWVEDCELMSPSGRKVSFHLGRQIAIFSRFTLNELLLDRAENSGAKLFRERVLKIDGAPNAWRLQTGAGQYSADFVVLAAGARNSLRAHFAPPLGPKNFMVAAGYYIPGNHHTVQIKFLKNLHGYIWIFPRSDHFSAGICGRMQGANTLELRRMLEASLSEFGLTHREAAFYAHIIPSLTPDALRSAPVQGDGWAMIGDAAGFVDAITGEGLYYALRSAELLSRSLREGAPQKYAELVRSDFLPELEHAARIAGRFYAGEWMGGNVLERMIQLTAHSSKFRDLMRDLFSGAQGYSSLRKRVYRSLPRIAAELIVSTVRSLRTEQAQQRTISLSS